MLFRSVFVGVGASASRPMQPQRTGALLGEDAHPLAGAAKRTLRPAGNTPVRRGGVKPLQRGPQGIKLEIGTYAARRRDSPEGAGAGGGLQRGEERFALLQRRLPEGGEAHAAGRQPEQPETSEEAPDLLEAAARGLRRRPDGRARCG